MSADSPTADWWCWTTNEPSTFRCRELGHDVRPRRPMPFERPAVDTLSTSARLALTERERDEAVRQCHVARTELDVTAAELVSARQEIEQLRAAHIRIYHNLPLPDNQNGSTNRMSRLVFIDTETTSLRPDRRAWEIGLIIRDDDKVEREYRWLIDTDDLDLGNADPFALKIGGFYERHSQALVIRHVPFGDVVYREYDALRAIEFFTRGAHLVGAVPNFDADVLGTRMRAYGIAPSWHYHLIDVEALAIGYLAGKGWLKASVTPWSSDELTAELGLAPVPNEERHTALGDARWARAIYDAVVTKSAP